MARRPFIPSPYYMTTASERAMQLLTSGSPEAALRLSLGHAQACWLCDDVEAQRGQPGYKSMTGEYVGDGLPDGHEEAFFWVGKKGTPSCDVLDHFSFGLWLKQKGGSQ